MDETGKLAKMLNTSRDRHEVEDWMFTLTPLGVAFVFFIVFILSSDIANKGLVMVVGTAAGFVGLQSYWVFRGWRKNHIVTVLMGVTSIALVLGLVWVYTTFAL
ncbi:MAG: hypothetical protein R3F42_01265 [Pseudomonadota bacterium]